MAKFYTILVFAQLALLPGAWAVTKTWINFSGGNWSDNANWEPIGAPSVDDDVVITGFSGLIIINTSATTIQSLTINGGSDVVFGGNSNGRRININCATCISSVEAGSSATFTDASFFGNGTCDLTVTSCQSFIIDGNLLFTGGISSDFVVSAGIVQINGKVTFDGIGNAHLGCTGGQTTVNGSIIYRGGGETTASSSTLAINGIYEIAKNGGSVPNIKWNTNSTLRITGMKDNDPYFPSAISTLGNLHWECAQQTVPAVFDIDISFNNVDIYDTGTSEIQIASTNGNQTRTWTIYNDYTQSGGLVNLSSGNNGTGKIDFKGSNFYASKTLTESGDGKGILEFSGSQPQIAYFGVVQNTVDVIVNTADKVLLNTQLIMNPGSTLSLLSGRLITSAQNLLTVSAGAFVLGGSIASFVDGPMRKAGNAAFTFPIGKGTRFASLSITAPAAVTDTFTAEYFPSSYTNVLNMLPPLVRVSHYEHWQLVRKSGTGPVQVTLYWQNGSASGIDDLGSLTAARFNGSEWVDAGGVTAGSVATGSVQSDTISAFNWLTFGAKLPGSNPLPVELKTFDVTAKEHYVDLRWTTASEKNSAWFVVERSTDGVLFAEIGRLRGAGNSASLLPYTFSDWAPAKGWNYYRLRQLDLDGQVSYSPVRSVTVETATTILLYPSPVANMLHIRLTDPLERDASWYVFDAAGHFVANGNLEAGVQDWVLPVQSWPDGTYSVRIKTDQGEWLKRFVKKTE